MTTEQQPMTWADYASARAFALKKRAEGFKARVRPRSSRWEVIVRPRGQTKTEQATTLAEANDTREVVVATAKPAPRTPIAMTNGIGAGQVMTQPERIPSGQKGFEQTIQQVKRTGIPSGESLRAGAPDLSRLRSGSNPFKIPTSPPVRTIEDSSGGVSIE